MSDCLACVHLNDPPDGGCTAYARIPHDIVSSEVAHDSVRGDERRPVAFEPREPLVASALDSGGMAATEEFAATACVHPDCDGWMTVHGRVTDVDVHGLRTVRCEDCGPLHIGSYGKGATDADIRRDVERQASCRCEFVRCDGSCAEWFHDAHLPGKHDQRKHASRRAAEGDTATNVTRIEGDVWDQGHRDAITRTTADLQARYDVPIRRVVHDPERSAAGKSNDTIYLPTMWSDRAAMAKREADFEGLVVEPTFEGTLVHEYGHMLDGAVTRNPKARAEWDAYLSEQVPGPGGRSIPRVRSGLEAASPYGAENRYEFAAEAFADHWHNGDNAGPAGKAYGAIVDRHLGRKAS